MEGRMTRRMIGALHARLPEAGLDEVDDPRRQASVRWSLGTILNTCVTAFVTGRQSLSQMEALTDEMSPALRAYLGLPRRLADTTVRDTLVQLEPRALRLALQRQVRAARRRKALAPQGLPFGVVSLDGKYSTVQDTKSEYTQSSSTGCWQGARLGTVTSSLISAAAKPCLDVHPIKAGWGEETVYSQALASLLAAYGPDLFKLVMYDAGVCSQASARETCELGLDYMFRLKQGKQQKLYLAAQQQLEGRPLDAADAVVRGTFLAAPERRSVYLCERVATWPKWTGMKTVVRILWEKLDDQGRTVQRENRYYVSSLAQDALAPEQWIAIGRGHWAVENNCHHTLDAVLREDDRQWITSDAQGTLVVMTLRRIAYNILSLFRSVTQRGADNRLTPWRDICRRFYSALLVATAAQLAGIRPRTVAHGKESPAARTRSLAGPSALPIFLEKAPHLAGPRRRWLCHSSLT